MLKMGKIKIGKHEIEQKYGYLIVDGEYYKDRSRDGKPGFKLVSKKEVTKAEKMSKEIAEKLKDSLDREKVIREAIMKLPISELEVLHNTVFNEKRKVNAKTREHHCVDMKVGNFILPIVDG